MVASVFQRTSDEDTFYYMTALANRRPLQVSILQHYTLFCYILFDR